jgi:predicted dehydrogenase
VETGHTPVYLATDDINLVALCDPAPERRTTVGQLLGVPEERQFAQTAALGMANVRPDVVVVATPSATHSAVIETLLRSGFGVVSEKPISPTAAECTALCELAAAYGRGLTVLHNYKTATTWRTAAAELTSRVVGEPVCFDVCLADPGPLRGFSPDAPLWRTARPLAGGGCLLDQGYHFVYLAESLLGSPVVAVRAESIHTRTPDWSVEDFARVRLTHANCAVTRLSLDWTVRRRRRPCLRVTGTQGSVQVDEDAARVIVRDHHDEVRVLDCSSDPDGYQRALPAAIRSVAAGGGNRYWSEQGTHVVTIIEACYTSARYRTEIALDC